MADEVEIRALYGELQGMLSQTPDAPKYIQDEGTWNRFNDIVDRLTKESGIDLSRFRIQPEIWSDGTKATVRAEFRQSVNALIMHLYYRYFPTDIPPFSGQPPSNVNVSTNVSQNQTVYFQMIIDFVSAMDKKVDALPDDRKEKQWWEKVKGTLGTMTSLAQLVGTLINSAQDYGLTIDQLKGLFA